MNSEAYDLGNTLSAVTSLQKSAIWSTLLLLIGVIGVVGSVAYSALKLAPLQEQVESKRAELDSVTLAAQEQIAQKAELTAANQRSKEELSNLRTAIDAAKKALGDINPRGLPKPVQDAVRSALAQVNVAESSLTDAQGTLAEAAAPPPENLGLQQSINGLFAGSASQRLKAYGAIMETYANDPRLVPALLEYSRQNTDNENGTYNALVVLSHIPKESLKPHVKEAGDYARSVEGNGTRTAERVNKLLSRLPE